MGELKEIIDNLLDKIRNMTELFYQHKNKEALEHMDSVLDSISVVSSQIAGDGECQNEVHILEILVEALGAFEAKDYILLSDILSYDMIEELERVKGKL